MATTMKLIAKNVLSSDTATVTFSSIPATYTDLMVVASARSTLNGGNDDLYMRFNGSTSSIYSARNLRGTGASALSSSESSQTRMYLQAISAATATANTFSSTEIYIPNYAGATNKSVSCSNLYESNSTTAIVAAVAGLWASTDAITEIALYTPTSSFKSVSSFFLYGITKA